MCLAKFQRMGQQQKHWIIFTGSLSLCHCCCSADEDDLYERSALSNRHCQNRIGTLLHHNYASLHFQLFTWWNYLPRQICKYWTIIGYDQILNFILWNKFKQGKPKFPCFLSLHTATVTIPWNKSKKDKVLPLFKLIVSQILARKNYFENFASILYDIVHVFSILSYRHICMYSSLHTQKFAYIYNLYK